MSRDNMDKHPDSGPLDPSDDHVTDGFGPEIDGEPSDADLLDALSDRDDDLLRRISLSMDDRLDIDEERDLKALLGQDDAAASIEGDLIQARAMLGEVADPPIPEGLLERTLARVSEASNGSETSGAASETGRILSMTRGLAMAAAVLLVGSLFAYSNHNGQVKAAPPTQTIEDQLDHGILDYLKLKFLGRSDSHDRSIDLDQSDGDPSVAPGDNR